MTGQWVSDGDDGCFWDHYGTGANECDPPGSWQLDGSTCYFDPANSGSDACTPPTTVDCVYENTSGPCATQGEVDDAIEAHDLAELEQESIDAEYVACQALEEDFCLNNPGQCFDEALRNAGPSAAPPCWDKMVEVATELGMSIWDRVKLFRAVSRGVLVPAGVLGLKVALMTVATAAAVIAIVALIECVELYYTEEELLRPVVNDWSQILRHALPRQSYTTS